ncbi:hypothetical protein Q428_15355 [Fervidicella metallireducens AeB]|uniref:Uncharacterized protein n=1 Tax=Fervidicella metallireducens AeB TaxID=1403537 RepID=A0A017RRN1_9CLOT|nr:hypothetical protein [Fervidicella metallireducens]EYE87099.1 hypothetical protein Q428_15355 [Fervidicella metallireducens AeB]
MEQLLQQIVNELKEIKNTQIESNERLIRIEKKLDAVYEQTANLTEFRTETNMKFDSLDEKMDNLQIDLNNLSVKTICNDNKIIEISRNLKNVK